MTPRRGTNGVAYLVKYESKTNITIIIVSDANSDNTTWDNTEDDIYERGEYLLDF